jgi:TPR repeat protein
VRLYSLAAEQGNASAQCNLGFCYENGTGVRKDPKEAVRLYSLSAEQGDASAQFNLGVCYVSVPRNTGFPTVA